MQKINILFLTIGSLKNINERGIYTDLVKKFEEKGHNIYVISPVEKREKKNTYLYRESNITFVRVKTGNLTKNNLIEKGINTLLIENLFKNAVKNFYGNIRFDLVLYSTPPITFSKVIEYVKKRDGAATYLLLKDIFPQNAVDLKIFKENSIPHIFFKKKEQHLYKISDHIGCMSKANSDYILEHNGNLDKNIVEINPNSIEPVYINRKRNQNIYEKYNLPKDKINFIYGGNLGKPQDIPFLIKCLRANENNKKVHFIIVGSGVNEKLVQEYYQNENSENLTFLNYLPKKEYDELIAVADVGMIFLDSKFTIPNFPSRILSYMEASLPILAATDVSTDVGSIAFENEFGHTCISDSVENFNSILPNFYNQLERERMGQNARDFLEENYTVENSYSTIMRHFN